MFQMTFGKKSLQQSGLFDAKLWNGPTGLGPDGVRQALVDRDIRVISVRSSSDTITRTQGRALASATGALDRSGQPLDFEISSDGSGMGSAIIDAVSLLSGNLEMDVGVILNESPDNPTPNFQFTVEAIDVAGDGCDAPIDTDGDAANLPDTHTNCRPGATPRFKVSFTNPAPPNSVPPNLTDPNGGYNMKLQLIGDGTYVVDEIPVYIIPEDVIPDPPTTVYADKGTYEQVVDATGCLGTERPLWRDLSWNATLPSGTKVVWKLCGGSTDAEVAACTPVELATVQSGNACTTQAECGNGYCDASGVCHYVSGATCTTDDDCGAYGTCTAGPSGNVCVWKQQPIDVNAVAANGMQGMSKMKVSVELWSNANHSQAPTVHDWRLNYTCTAQE